MQLLIKALLCIAVLLPNLLVAQGSHFSADSAYAYTRHLSVTIGPRPMGSANEQTALKWAVDKFKAYGADSAYVLPFSLAKTPRKVINTSSGIAVGIFKGETDSSIVIGGHIDSSGPEIPGANDDASGTACAIEIARIWGQLPRHYTLVFAAFGGEEQGLMGSTYFVDHFQGMDKVALMLEIDMAASTENLVPFLETKDIQAPKWLVEDAFAIDRATGTATLQYPSYFFALNSLLDAASSDHAPFLEKGIPAIDFTAGINASAIHTPRDRFEFVDKSMLARSGKLVNGMLHKYQEHGIPAQRIGNYMLWPVFGARFYVPSQLVTGTVIFALLLSIWAFIHARTRRLQIPKTERVRFSGVKIVLLMLVIAIFTQLGETGIQVLKGLRYPWLAHINEYMRFAALWAIAGLWVAMHLTRKWRYSPDPYVYSKRALVIVFTFTLLLAIASFRVAFHLALPLLLISLAIITPNRLIKTIAGMLAPIPMFKLMFTDVFPMIARSSAGSGFVINSAFSAFIYSAVLTVVLLLWYLPLIYFYSYLATQVKALKYLFIKTRGPVFGMLVVLAIFGYGGYLYSLPAYNDIWRAGIHATAKYNLRTNESSLEIIGNEYFHNVKIVSDSLSETLDADIHKHDIPISFQANWFKVTGSETLASGEQDTLNVNWLLTTNKPWYKTVVKLQTDSLGITEILSEQGFVHKNGQAAFTWSAEPADTLQLQARLILPSGTKLIREVTATYLDMPMPIDVTAELADVSYRTTVVAKDTLILHNLQTTAKF